jgi:glucosamine-6-phosphate deaminase
LDHITRVDASSDFNGIANVPKIAITMGFHYFAVQENCFAGLGQNKADIIKRTIQEDISAEIPATFMQNHEYHFVLDQSAASELTRFKTPLVGDCVFSKN